MIDLARLPTHLLLTALALAACGDSQSDSSGNSATSVTSVTSVTNITTASSPTTSDPQTGGPGTTTSAETGSVTSTVDPSGPDPTGGTSTTIKYDLLPPETTGVATTGRATGCTGVDLLFVIDNSTSMNPYQEALAATFPLFVAKIFEVLPPGTDLHVGLTATSFGSPQAGGPGSGGCNNENNNAEALADHYPPPSQPNGQNGGQGRLYVQDGKTFFAVNTSDGPAALSSWFTAAAQGIGESGSNWEMVSAGAAFVAHPDNAAANAGFIRDEGTVLVVFILSDEYDNSPESASSYHDLLAGAKSGCGGDLCIVPAGLIPPCVPDTPNNVLRQFLYSFGKDPIWGDIGEPEDTAHYPQVLGDALASIIVQTCEQIDPPL